MSQNVTLINSEKIAYESLLTQTQNVLDKPEETSLLELLQVLPSQFSYLPLDTRLALINIFAEYTPKEFIHALPELLSALPEETRITHLSPKTLQTLADKTPDQLLKFLPKIINLVPNDDRSGLIMPNW